MSMRWHCMCIFQDFVDFFFKFYNSIVPCIVR